MSINYTINDLKEAFTLMDDWEDRYRFLIELGGQLPPMAEELKTESSEVRGCTSQVWMVMLPSKENKVDFLADSDAQIVRGLIAVLFAIYHGQPMEKVKDIDVDGIFDELGLSSHISPNRRSGFFSMVEKLKTLSAG